MNNTIVKNKSFYINFNRIFTLIDYYIPNLNLKSKQYLCDDVIRSLSSKYKPKSDLLALAIGDNNTYIGIPTNLTNTINMYMIRLLNIYGVTDLEDMMVENWNGTYAVMVYLV